MTITTTMGGKYFILDEAKSIGWFPFIIIHGNCCFQVDSKANRN